MKNFVGFYTTPSFWAGGEIDIEANKSNLNKVMSQEVFIYETDKYILKICKDGMILFQIKEIASKNEKLIEANTIIRSNLTEDWTMYLNYLNCIYLLLESQVLEKLKMGLFNISEVTNKDAFSISEGGGCGIPIHSIQSQYIMGRYLSGYRDGIPLELDTRIIERREIPEIVFKDLHSNFAKVYDNYENIKTLSLITKSIGEYKITNYSVSLVLSWFIIETYLNCYWERFLDSKNKTYSNGNKKINSDRMKNFFDSKNYPINVISNILELSDEITFEIFEKIDKIRKIRNDIVHQKKELECTAEDCRISFDIIKEFMAKEMGINLEFNLSITLSGL